jgi:hypothetical protein
MVASSRGSVAHPPALSTLTGFPSLRSTTPAAAAPCSRRMATTTGYLICFQPGIPRGARPGNASHCLGSTSYADPSDRLREHLTSAGIPLVKAARDRLLTHPWAAHWQHRAHGASRRPATARPFRAHRPRSLPTARVAKQSCAAGTAVRLDCRDRSRPVGRPAGSQGTRQVRAARPCSSPKAEQLPRGAGWAQYLRIVACGRQADSRTYSVAHALEPRSGAPSVAKAITSLSPSARWKRSCASRWAGASSWAKAAVQRRGCPEACIHAIGARRRDAGTPGRRRCICGAHAIGSDWPRISRLAA